MNLYQYRFHLWWLIPLLIVDAFLFSYWWRNYYKPAPQDAEITALPPAAGSKIHFGYPTKRQFDRWSLDAFQPTASGRPESAFYGSVRSALLGKRLFPSFHEGLDISALIRDRAGRPQDAVFAAADGEVAYVNPHAGNSNYGKYVVLLHGAGPGRLYSLYAHLAEIGSGIVKGARVAEGSALGIMGSTSTDRIPAANGHLHFEIGLMLNARFDRWFRRHKLTPDHGLFNGWNLIGIDPLLVYEMQEEEGGVELRALLAAVPRAFELVLKTPRQLDFFKRCPPLWHGPEFSGGAMVIACSENGLPLGGRCAGQQETAELGRRTHFVLHVDPSTLGRNGCRIVVCENGKWRLGAEGEKWLSRLVY